MPSKFKSQARTIPAEESVGAVLAHDVTEIRAGRKGPLFRKGHVIRVQDVPSLLRAGKQNVYALTLDPAEAHEDEAAEELARAFSGPGVEPSGPPSEGKVILRSARGGLFKVAEEALIEVNLIPDICCCSRHGNTVVGPGDALAAVRAVPLVISRELLGRAVAAAEAAGGLFRVLPLKRAAAFLVVTGSEVYRGLIRDRFAPVVEKKLSALGSRLERAVFVPDERSAVAAAIAEVLAAGAELVLVSGGMSVDPDDVSRLGIADAGAEDVVYGAPVLPGAMFLCGRIGEVPVLGLPACVIHSPATALELILPRVLAGERITRRDLAALAPGGMCLNCPECRYPVCPFGK